MGVYYGKRSNYRLGTKLGSGGEGDVYEVVGNPGLVVKLYSDQKFISSKYVPDPRKHLKEKIETMLAQPVDPYINGILTVAWPQDILFDSMGDFVGYVMPKVKDSFPIYYATRTRERMQMFPDYTWKTAVAIAFNLSVAVKKVHGTGAVIADFNQNNIMIDKQGHVCLIDTDSYTIISKRTGETYKCSVGVSEVLAPELQGRNLAEKESEFTKESDSFSLGIHIFNLLMNNCHPFGCVKMNEPKGSYPVNPVETNIVNGYCPYINGEKKARLALTAPDIKMIPYEVRRLWERTFSYNTFNALSKDVIRLRPTALEWQKALYDLHNSTFIVCKKDKSHAYPETYDHCPWCDIEKRKNYIPPNKTTGAKINNAIGMTVSPTNVVKNVATGVVQPQKNSPQSPIKRPARRGSIPLWVLCLGVGSVASPLILGNLLVYSAFYFFGVNISIELAYIALAIAGLISGVVICNIVKNRYMSYYIGWPWLLLSVLSPIGSGMILALLAIVIWIIVMAVSALLGVLGVALVVIFIFSVVANL